MTKFPNPFELLEKKKNLEYMQNINDAKFFFFSSNSNGLGNFVI